MRQWLCWPSVCYKYICLLCATLACNNLYQIILEEATEWSMVWGSLEERKIEPLLALHCLWLCQASATTVLHPVSLFSLWTRNCFWCCHPQWMFFGGLCYNSIRSPSGTRTCQCWRLHLTETSTVAWAISALRFKDAKLLPSLFSRYPTKKSTIWSSRADVAYVATSVPIFFSVHSTELQSTDLPCPSATSFK